MKLIEEVGELSEVLRKDRRLDNIGDIKGTVEEELCDVLYYIVALANVYDINLNRCFQLKDELNKVKWKR
jgi:NTP pyrophosphatase (non-canonical NTP hydrolase)